MQRPGTECDVTIPGGHLGLGGGREYLVPYMYILLHVKVSTSLTNVGSLAVGAFDLVNCPQSVYKEHGTAMGSPVPVVVAEIVMQHVEEGRQGAVYKLRSNAPTARTITLYKLM